MDEYEGEPSPAVHSQDEVQKVKANSSSNPTFSDTNTTSSRHRSSARIGIWSHLQHPEVVVCFMVVWARHNGSGEEGEGLLSLPLGSIQDPKVVQALQATNKI